MANVFPKIFITVVLIALLAVIIWRWEINGWGSLVWVVTAFIMTAIRAPHAARNKQNVVTQKYQVSMERVLLALVAIGGSYLPILHLATGLLSSFNYVLGNVATTGGVLLTGFGLLLFWRSHADLGRNWSVTTETREEHTLVTTGIYKKIRHPMYSAIWLLFLAQPLLLHNWVAGFGGLITFGLMYFIRVPYEEEMMREQFGVQYDEYCKRTGRLWPR